MPCLVAGGVLTGYIGISIEKVLFVLLTLSGEVPVLKATVTSITLVGWISGIAFLMHATSPCDPLAPWYIGAVPYRLECRAFWSARASVRISTNSLGRAAY